MRTKILEAIGRHVNGQKRKQKSYRNYGESIDNPDGECIYRDNGSDVLIVAHLDTVLWAKRPKFSRDRISRCPQLDDRLGAAIALDLVGELLGFAPDVLLTDCEEVGRSTASYLSREHRLAIQFDRAGSDVVNYSENYPSLDSTLATCGIVQGTGSYSDVAELSGPALNWGCGYHDQHTSGCYCDLAEVELQLLKFAFWYREFGARQFPYVAPRKKVWRGSYALSRYEEAFSRREYKASSTIVERNLLSDDEYHLLEE